MEIEPPTINSTRLRPVSAHVDPQIMRTVQASASRPNTMKMPAAAPAMELSPGMSVLVEAPPARAPTKMNAIVARTPSAPQMNPKTAAVTTPPGRAGRLPGIGWAYGDCWPYGDWWPYGVGCC